MMTYRLWVFVLIFTLGCSNDPLNPVTEPVQEEPTHDPPATPQPSETCNFSTEFSANDALAQTDIIWVVDSSSSMSWEMDTVQDGLNSFSADITSSGIEHHVVLIGDASHMQVPPPLGGSANFRHVDRYVGSENALQHVLDEYPNYADFLRPNSVKHIVVVSDDDSAMNAFDFKNALSGLTDPGFAPTWYLHAIVAFGGIPYIGCYNGAKIGQTYIDLADTSGGTVASICESNWNPIFAALHNAVAETAALDCQIDIPIPTGALLNTELTRVTYQTTSGADVPVDRAATCHGGSHEWLYDNLGSPTQVILCPFTCDVLRQDHGHITAMFGCSYP